MKYACACIDIHAYVYVCTHMGEYMREPVYAHNHIDTLKKSHESASAGSIFGKSMNTCIYTIINRSLAHSFSLSLCLDIYTHT